MFPLTALGVRKIQSRVSLKEVEWPDLELAPNRGLYGPIFRPNHVVKSERIPEHDVGIVYGTIGARPGGKAIISLALVRVFPGRISLFRPIWSHPKMRGCISELGVWPDGI